MTSTKLVLVMDFITAKLERWTETEYTFWAFEIKITVNLRNIHMLDMMVHSTWHLRKETGVEKRVMEMLA